jgi:D-xylose transport system ATP-binding protein
MTDLQDARPAPDPSVPAPLLSAEAVSLSFGNVRALRDVALHLRPGEVTALVGDNGAGKSTLVRCISGIHRPDSGEILFDGRPIDFRSPEDAREAGIETVHQNLALVEDLTVWQNLFLNRELVRRVGPLALLNRRAMQRQASEMVSTLAVNVPAVTSRVRRLSGGQRQAVAICRAAGFSSKLVIMDEPTAALGVQETARVEELILRLRDEGHAVLLVSHNFAQVMRLSDQVWVMRAGRCVAGRRTAQTTGEEIVALITGALAA